MGNMSYCRMINTYHDLRDVYEHLGDDDLSDGEKKYSKEIIELCKQIVEDFRDD